jgi:hypothetical protein
MCNGAHSAALDLSRRTQNAPTGEGRHDEMSTTMDRTTHNGQGSTATLESPYATTAPGTPEVYETPEVKGAGWIVYAATMLGLAGTLAVLDGIVALSRSSFYAAGARFVFSDLRTWGWITLALGVVAILAAFAIVAGAAWGRWFGITVASLNAIGQLAWIQAYPWWSVAIFTLDMLVIYALAVYGGKKSVVT